MNKTLQFILMSLIALLSIGSVVGVAQYKLLDPLNNDTTGYNVANGWVVHVDIVPFIFVNDTFSHDGNRSMQVSENNTFDPYISTTTNMTSNMSCGVWMSTDSNAIPGTARTGMITQLDDEPLIVKYAGNSTTNWVVGSYSGVKVDSGVALGSYVWHRMIMTHVGNGTVRWYIDSNLIRDEGGRQPSMQKLWLGMIGGNFGAGYVYYDDLRCWNGSLTDEPGYVPYFVVASKDAWDNVSVGNFSVLLNGSLYSTNNGLVNTLIGQEGDVLLNMTVMSNGYFNFSLSNVNLSNNVVVNLSQSDVIINMSTIKNQVYGNLSFNGSYASSHVFLRVGSYVVNFSNASYFNKSFVITVPALFNGTFNISNVTNSWLNVSYENNLTLQNLSVFNVTIYNSQYNYFDSLLVNKSYFDYQVLNGTGYEVNFSKVGFARNHSSFSMTSMFNNFSVVVFPTPSVLIRVFDERNTSNNILNFSVVATTTNGSYFNSYSTVNGSYIAAGIPLGVYNFIVSSNGYSDRSYVLNVIDDSVSYSLNAYLSNSSQQTLFVVRNSANTVLSNAQLVLTSLDNNSNTIIIGSGLTDVSGQISFNLIYLKTYGFVVSAPSYASKSGSIQIIDAGYSIYVDSSIVSPFNSSARSNYNLLVSPSYKYYNLSPSGYVEFNVSASSVLSNLEYLRVSVHVESLTDCLGGGWTGWDGENCTRVVSGNPNFLNTGLLNTSVWYNPRLNLNVITKIVGFPPDTQVFYYMNSPLQSYGQAYNRSIQLGFKEAFDKSTYSDYTKVLIIFVCALVVGLFFYSIGLPSLLIVMIVLAGFMTTVWVVIDNTFVQIMVSLVGLILTIGVIRSGG